MAEMRARLLRERTKRLLPAASGMNVAIAAMAENGATTAMTLCVVRSNVAEPIVCRDSNIRENTDNLHGNISTGKHLQLSRG
jgi:hypothetical protein